MTGDRITDILAAHCRAERADPMPERGSPAWLDWFFRSGERTSSTIGAIRLEELTAGYRQRTEDEGNCPPLRG